MTIERTLCDQCGKVISEKETKTDKDKFLEFWTPTYGEEETLKLWERKLASLGVPQKSVEVISDITPYVSMIDGSLITSRSKHKQHLKEHGCIEVGNEKMEARTTSWIESKSNKEALRREIAARLDSIS